MSNKASNWNKSCYKMLNIEDIILPRPDNKLKQDTILTSFPPRFRSKPPSLSCTLLDGCKNPIIRPCCWKPPRDLKLDGIIDRGKTNALMKSQTGR
jgi:hypothetical protein